MTSTFPEWIYDNSPIPDPMGKGERAVEFLRCLKHPNSAAPKRALQLADWQERIVRRIYGPRNSDGSRVVKTVFMLLPRGNRKTSLSAALSLLHLLGLEKVPAGQCLFTASSQEQASIGFKQAVGIVREDKKLVAATKIRDAFNSKKQIAVRSTGSTLTTLSADGGAAQGLTPSFVLVDEIHVWKGRDLWEAIKYGMLKVDDTLMVIATTAGRGSENLAADLYNYAVKVASGEIDNPEFLPILFQAGPDDDWRDEQVWHRANPGLKHGFPSMSGLRSAVKEAEHRPTERTAFLQFVLNIWQANSRDPLFSMDTYDARRFDDDPADLEALPCWIGVDLAKNGDTSAVVAAWLHDDGQITIKPWFFVPGEDLAGRADRDGVPYVQWRDAGLLTATPGPIIDPEIVEDHIRELCATFDVQEVAFDPHLARRTMQNLLDDGLPVVEFRQAPLSMGVAIGDLERTGRRRNNRAFRLSRC